MISEARPELHHPIRFGPPRFLLDANVLASAAKRDILLSFASEGICTVHWSNVILDETYKALMQIFTKRSIDSRIADIRTHNSLNRIITKFPSSTLTIRPSEFEQMNSLPDPNDNHVLVAAIRRQVHYIVTENVRDFPNKNLRVAGTHPLLEAVSKDNVIELILKYNTQLGLRSIKLLRNRLKNPALSAKDLLDNWERTHGLKRTVAILRVYENQL